ncbi:hypothetical protein JCM10049v2_001640 [Rhodotorula toruloides]
MKICIFGGNGFVGAAVARKAVARGWKVVSVSRSGTPFATPAGHAPAWVNDVEWRKGSAFDAATYDSILPSCDGLVTTLGALFESDYKDEGLARPLSVLRAIAENATGSRGNPLAVSKEKSYERLNRDSAIDLFEAFRHSRSPSVNTTLPPFVFISAEDIFRPFVPERYIKTKREAEHQIWSRTHEDAERPRVRPIFVRPSLMYHPHLNPPSTLPATLLEASAKLRALIPPALRLAPSPPPSPIPTTEIPPAYASLASLMSIPPIHVDAVGDAVCQAMASPDVEGVVDVQRMRDMLGFDPLGWSARRSAV